MGSTTDGASVRPGREPGHGGPERPMLVGVCGGSGSGKTTLTRRLVDAFGPDRASRLSFDAYYRELTNLSIEERADTNFDHPDSLDADLLVEHLRQLRDGNEVAVPVYDFTTHARTADVDVVGPRPFIIVEGVLLFAFAQVRERLDFLVFRHCPEPVRARRRFERDVIERGRTPESVRHQWRTTVQPMYEIHVEPYVDHADLVVGGDQDLDNTVEAVVATLLNRQLALITTG